MIEYHSLAAAQGYAAAQYSLGMHYKTGDVVEKNLTEALKYFSEASEKGLCDAIHQLGRCYEIGVGVEMNLSSAIGYYVNAAQYDHLLSITEITFLLKKVLL